MLRDVSPHNKERHRRAVLQPRRKGWDAKWASAPEAKGRNLEVASPEQGQLQGLKASRIQVHIKEGRKPRPSWCRLGLFGLITSLFLWPLAADAQVESIPSSPPEPVFVSHGRVEGHLALNYSPAGEFSPDSQTLAVVNQDKVALLSLREGTIAKVLRPRVPDVVDLDIDSASFLSATRLFVLARGLFHAKGQPDRNTPLLGFQWYVDQDSLFGTVHAMGAGGGYAPILYFPHLGYIGMYKESKLTLWNPNSNRGAQFTLSELTHTPQVIALSSDGRWILLAHIETSASPDPVVMDTRQQKFVDVLPGHHGTVLSIRFSPDGQRVATGCEDGQVRLWSVADWKLLATLSGHVGPVHWADFSPDGKRIASAGEDKTLRIWSVSDGRLLQTLEESREPLRTAAFSPDASYVAATSDQNVLVWQRR
jgi:hypothetical protein